MKTPKSRQNPEIKAFILKSIEDHPQAVGALVAEKFQISRTAAGRYLKRLETDGLIEGEGKTSARRYVLKPVVHEEAVIQLTPDMYESEVWEKHFAALTKDLPKNVADICYYGFTEIFNNAIDHSESETALVQYDQYATKIVLSVTDRGVGIFAKIQRDFKLADPRAALLELSKGKLTSDPKRHSGEGIFFTSRMFNTFGILSGNLYYSRSMLEDDDGWGWLIDSKDRPESAPGTFVQMEINLDADWTTKAVFDKFQNEDMDFAKTHVPVFLARFGQEQLVSRSQAKRILARFDKFEEVMLDFRGVPEIGQAFADEIFRVYQNAHPEIKIVTIGVSEDVQKMIDRSRRSNPTSPADGPIE
ncbi:hypothetical protein sos41_32270 [Alphaproteobacteria bacterium SO-S41]|nr:hypothetical protein sos41_32270 [Alphaproteobacteria bacterium SO-S41]